MSHGRVFRLDARIAGCADRDGRLGRLHAEQPPGKPRLRGRFSQFYIAGTIVRRGEAKRLYDQPYFRHLQESLRDDPLRLLYPPTLGLLMAPSRGFPTTRPWPPGGRSKPSAYLRRA